MRRVWQWREESGATIIDQFQQLGCSLDYEHERFTMDDEYARAVVSCSSRCTGAGYLYRANRMVNWCPVCDDGDLGPRGRARRGGRHALLDRLPARRRRPRDGRDGAPRDAARRHGRRRQPGRRALPRPHRPARDRAARRARGADRRRRARRSRRRHGRAQGHARATTRTTSRSAAATASRRSP